MNIISFINKILLVVLLVLAPITINSFYLSIKNDYVVFLNIGQGDSTLICNKFNNCGLIDTGKQSSVIEKVKEYTNKPLEFLLLTHPDADHVAESAQVIQQIGAKKVFFASTNKGAELRNQLLKFSIKLYELREDNDFSFGNYNFDVLWPSNTVDLNQLESNDTSTTLIISNKNMNLFLAGDLGTRLEEINYQKYQLKNVNILKLSHHGSKNSSSRNFLANLNPTIGIISVGKNSYGHPSKQAIENLNKLGIQYLRTDLDGNIKIDIFNENLSISTQNSKKSYIILN